MRAMRQTDSNDAHRRVVCLGGFDCETDESAAFPLGPGRVADFFLFAARFLAPTGENDLLDAGSGRYDVT